MPSDRRDDLQYAPAQWIVKPADGVAVLPGRATRYTVPMSASFTQVAADALTLDPAERLRLADALLDSVESRESPDWAQNWARELERRSAAADARESAGGARGESWEIVRERLKARLSQP